MSKIGRLCLISTLIFTSIAAIGGIGREYFALLAISELLIGVIIGMVIFLPMGTNRKTYQRCAEIAEGFSYAGAIPQQILKEMEAKGES